MGRLFFDDEVIHTYGDLFVRFGGTLVLVAGIGDFFLRISALDGLDHAPHPVEFFEVVEGALFHVERLLLEEVGTAQRIDGLGDTGFISNDLLRA